METAGQRLVSNLDAFALGGFCVAWAKAERAHKELQEHGYTISYTSKSGNEYSQPSPWVAIEKAAWDHVLKFAREFGFTPASRTNIQLSPDKGQKSDLDKDQLKRLFG